MAVNGIIGIKLGMTQVSGDGTLAGCTVLQAGPCVVVQRRTKQNDGYEPRNWDWWNLKPQRREQGHDRALQEGQRRGR